MRRSSDDGIILSMPNINLFIWRHAEAEDSSPDLARPLTARGQRDAARVAKALARHVDEKSFVVCSPAVRARETVAPLIARVSAQLEIDPRLAPDTDVEAVLNALEAAIASCHDDPTMVMVGHQPWVGQLARRLLTDEHGHWSVKKASAWWLVRRSRDGSAEWTLKSVLDPELV
jgi:phosphohistidine phosphatase